MSGGLVRWGRRGLWAILDQGFFAVTNFLISVWLARTLSRADYGVFALGYTLLLLVGACFLGLFGEPISVFGSGKYRERFREYVGTTFVGWVVVSLATFGAFCGVALLSPALGIGDVAPLLIVVGGAAPLVALLRQLRMCAYAAVRPALAALGSGIHLSTVVAVMILWPSDRVTMTVGFVALAAGVIPSAGLLYGAMRARIPGRGGSDLYRAVLLDHLDFGRWSVGANLLLWVPGNAVYFFLSAWGGVEAAGILKALRTLTTPVMHSIYALTSVLMPKLVQARGTALHARVGRLGMLAFVGVAVAYWLVIAIGGRLLLDLAYDGGYNAFAPHLTVLAVVPVIAAVMAVLGAILRSFERPRDVFVGNAVSAVCTLTLGAAMIYVWALAGAIGAIVISTAAVTGTLAVQERRARRWERRATEAPVAD